jgi:hypothetical protein
MSKLGIEAQEKINEGYAVELRCVPLGAARDAEKVKVIDVVNDVYPQHVDWLVDSRWRVDMIMFDYDSIDGAFLAGDVVLVCIKSGLDSIVGYSVRQGQVVPLGPNGNNLIRFGYD